MNFFALYKVNSFTSNSSLSSADGNVDGSIISLLSTNLDTENGNILKDFLSKKLSKSSLFSGSGTVTNIPLSLNTVNPESGTKSVFSLYHCLLKSTLGIHSTSLEKDFERICINDCVEDHIPISMPKNDDIIVCFLHSNKQILELFHYELNQFCDELYDIISNSHSNYESLNEYIINWFHTCVLYIVRCVNLLHDKLHIFLALASRNIELEIICDDTDSVKELKLFKEACNIFEGYMSKRPEGDVISLQIVDNDLKIHSTLSSQHCIDLASKLAMAAMPSKQGNDDAMNDSFTPNPVAIKLELQRYKLKANQDMNAAKRLVSHAVNDYYALHRLYQFLRSNDNWRLIVYHLTQSELPAPQENEVIEIVKEFLESQLASSNISPVLIAPVS